MSPHFKLQIASLMTSKPTCSRVLTRDLDDTVACWPWSFPFQPVFFHPCFWRFAPQHASTLWQDEDRLQHVLHLISLNKYLAGSFTDTIVPAVLFLTILLSCCFYRWHLSSALLRYIIIVAVLQAQIWRPGYTNL